MPRKNEPKARISPTTRISAAKTTPLAISIGIRRGTASSDARITPVEYSVVMTSTPRTQIASWPRPNPPRMVLTGSAMIARVPRGRVRAVPVGHGQGRDQRGEAQA